MHRKIALAFVVAVAATGPVLAEDGTIEPPPFVSTASRAAVIADMQQARQQGNLPWADEYLPTPGIRSMRTRAEVTREYLASRNEVAAFNGEDSGPVYLARREAGSARNVQLAVAPADAQ